MAKWHNLAPYDPALVQCVTGFLGETQRHREARSRAAAVLAWSYERDRHLLLAQSSSSNYPLVPDHVARVCDWLRQDRVPSINIVKSATDTGMSYLFTDPDPLVVGSDGAGFEEIREVEARSMALNATMNTPEAHDELWRVQRDFFLKGHAAAIPYFDGARICYRRLLEHQLAWDPYEAQDGEAFTRASIEVKDRQAFIAWYRALVDIPSHPVRIRKVEELKSTPSRVGAHSPYDFELQTTGPARDTDLIVIVNIYRRASYEGAEDGRHTMLVYGCAGDVFQVRGDAVIALDKTWPRASFPIVTGAPWPADQGPCGVGMGDLLLPWQRYVDGLLYKIITTNEKYGYIKVVTPDTGDERMNPALAALATEGINVVRLPPGVNNPPAFLDPQVIRKEDLQQLEFALRNSTSYYGINQVITQAGSQLGAGASGAALIEESYRPIDRLSDVVERWERVRIQIGRETLNLIDDVLKVNASFRARYEDQNGRRVVRSWADLRKHNEEYVIDVERTGSLGRTRAGRKQNVIEGAKMGIISQDDAKEALLRSPDFRRSARLSLAGRLRIESQLDGLIRGTGDLGRYFPDEDNDLPLAVTMAGQHINLAYAREAKDDTIQRLREYKRQAQTLLDAITAANTPPAPIMPAGPGPAGMDPLLAAAAAQEMPLG